jgi:hypothetical protein
MRKYIITISFVLFTLFMMNVAFAAEPLIQATFSTNPIIASPGNDGYIQLTLKNSGTVSVSRITISSVSFDSNIIPSEDWVGDLSSLAAGDSTISLFKFKVAEKASSGLHTVTFHIDYGADYVSRTIDPNMIINVQSPSTLEFTSIDPASLKPGENRNVIFTITNKGDSSIPNVIFTWTSSGNVVLPLGSGNRVVIPSIGANSYYNLSVEVSVSPSATPGLYPLSTVIQFSDKSGTNQIINSTAGIEIGGETDFDVSLQESTAGTVSLSVANIGVNPATSVAISIPEQDRFSVTGATSVLLGDLNSGEYTMASFQLTSRNVTQNIPAMGNASQIRNVTEGNLLKVEISYTDTTGFRQTVQKQVSVTGSLLSTSAGQVRTQTRNGLGIWLYVIIGAVGIIAVVVYFKFFRRKKK